MIPLNWYILTLCAVSDIFVVPADNYMFRVKNRNTRTRCEICSKLTTKTQFTPCSSVSIVNFDQANAGWKRIDCLTYILCYKII